MAVPISAILLFLLTAKKKIYKESAYDFLCKFLV